MGLLRRYNNKGQLLIELLIALGLSMILIPAIAAGFIASRQGKAQEHQRLEATALARQLEEVVRIIQSGGWNNIAVNGTYHPEISGSTWTLATGSTQTNGYTESVTIASVMRDSSGSIVQSGGVLDSSTKYITVDVSWGSPIPSLVTHSFYLTRRGNQTWFQTTQADFDSGTKTDVITTNESGGEVTLGAGGRADWCNPELAIAAVDLPKSGVANAVSAISGKVFAGTGENASGVSYGTVLVDNANPPNATVSGTFNGFKTNGIFGESAFAYLATDNNAKEIVIINIGATPYTEAGYFNAPGNGNGDSIAVSGNVGYMVSGNDFYTFDLTSKSGSRPQMGTTQISGIGKKIFVIGSYAYVAIDSEVTQMEILDITNSAAPVIVGRSQLAAGAGKDVFVNQSGTRAYLATAVSTTQPELFILDVTTKAGFHNIPIGTYDSNGMDPRGITVVPGNRAILVGIGAEEYQAIQIFTETAPYRCGGIDINTGVNGVSSVLEEDGDAFSYIITGDATTELKIIEGGPGGKFANTGTFESSTFDAGTSVAFNRFTAGVNLHPYTTIEYQVAGSDPVDGSCANAAFTFVGSDGTGLTTFATNSAIPLTGATGYKNPAQCFRYKTILSAEDPLFAPMFTDMRINYSP